MARWNQQLGRALVAVALATSCGESDQGGVASDSSVDGATDASAASLVGRAWMGAPIRGARVEVFAYDDLVRGVTYGETITNIDGRFGMPMPDFEGRIVIRVSGTNATYTNPVTGESEHFGESDELFATVVLGPGLAGRELQVDLLTTLATTYALSLRELEGPERGISLAVERFAQHIHPDVFDATEIPRGGGGALVWPSPEAAVTLFHMGLHEVWAETIAMSGSPRPGTGTTVASASLGFIAFARALRRDLRDGVFDGLEHKQPAWSGGPALDAEPTRARLAEATKRWNDAQDGWTGLTTEELTGPDGFCTLVSTDVGPLYPSGTPGSGGAYDPVPPVLSFEPPTPGPLAALRSDFLVRGRVSDPGGLSAIVLSGVALGATPSVDLDAGVFEALVPVGLNPDGEYTLVLSATDRSGNSAYIERAVLLDTTAPALDVAIDGALSLGAIVLPTAELRLEGTVSDSGSGLSALWVGPAGGQRASVVFTEGQFSYDVTLDEGTHHFEVEARDVAGNAAQSDVVFTIDLIGPTLEVLSPPPGGLVGPGSFEVVVSASDPAQPVVVEVRGVGGGWVLADGLPSGDYQVALPSPLVDGPFAFDVRGRDGAGHESLETASVVRDGTPPVVGSIEVLGAMPAPGGHRFWTAAAEVAVRVQAADAHGIQSVDVAGIPAAPNGASWSALVPVLSETLASVVVSVRDPVLNEALLSVEIGRDLAPPTCTLNPPSGSGWTSATSLVVDGMGVDGGVGAVDVAIEGGLSVAPALVVGDAFQGTVLLPASDVELRARCTDALGNASDSPAVSVRVDRKAPIVVLSPPDGAHLNSNLVEVTLAVTEHSGVERAELRTAGGDFVQAELISDGNVNEDWQFRLALPLQELDGVVTVDYRVVDLAGNVTQGQIDYEKDASAPVFGAVDVVGAVVRDEVHYVRDAFATVRIALLDAPGAVGGVTVSGLTASYSGGVYQAFVDLAGETGAVSVPLVAWDLAGNARTTWITIMRDTAPPSCALGSPGNGGYTQGGQFSLGAITEDDGVGGVSVRVVLGDAVGPVLPASGSNFDVVAGPLPVGPTFVSLLCQDALGNSLSSPAVLVTRDLDAPVISDCVPAAGTVLGADPFEVSCRVDDVDPTIEVLVETESPGVGPLGGTVAASFVAGRYRASVEGYGALGKSGPGRARIIARDRAGGVSEVVLEYDVDLDAPEITGISAALGVLLPTGETAVRSGSVALSVGATDAPAGVAAVRIGRPGQGAPAASDTATFQGGAYVAQRIVASPGGDVVIDVDDAVGNRATALHTLLVDDEPPTCTISPLPGGGSTAMDSVPLQVASSDALAGGAMASPYRAGLPAGGAAAGPSATLVALGLVEGPNEVWARCTDALGNAAESQHLVVTRDSTPPVIEIVSPLEGGFVSALGGVIVAKVTDASAVTVTVRSQGGEPVAAASAGGQWSTSFSAPLQADGEFWVDVTAQDTLGNTSVKRHTLRRDGTPPALGVAEVSGAVVLSGTHWVRGPLALVRLPVTDLGAGIAGVTIGGKPAALLGGAYEASVAAQGAAATVSYGATDAVGNTSTGQLILRADAEPPTCELEKSGAAKVWRKVSGLYGAYVKAIDTGVGTGGVDIVTGGVVTPGEPAMLAPGVPVPDTFLGWLTVDGPSHQVTAVCRDRLGNSQDSGVLEIGLDMNPPTIADVTPASGSFVRSGPLQISATITDSLSGLTAVKVIGGGITTMIAGPPFPSPIATTVTVPKGASTYSLAYYADDLAGNGAVQSPSYHVDDTPPTLVAGTTIAGSTTADGVRWVPSKSAVLTAQVTDPAGVGQVHFGTVLATLKKDHATGVVTATATVSDIPTSAPKAYDLKATDALGNVKVLEPVWVQADITPPTCILLDPADDHWTNDPYPIANVESSDAGIGQLTVTLAGGNDVDLKATYQGGSFAAALTLSGAEVDSVQATCVDGVGNVAQSTVALVHFDDVAPTIVILPTTTKDYSGTTVDVTASPPKVMGTPATSQLNEASCGGGAGCPPLSVWSHLGVFSEGEVIGTTQTPFLSVNASDDRGWVDVSYATIATTGATILAGRPLASASYAGLTSTGVPLVPAYLTDATVITPVKWPRRIRLLAADRAGNTTERVIPIQVQLLASPMRTNVVTGTAAPDLAGLSVAGALASAFSVSPPAPWSTLGGLRVLHLEVENPYNVELPARFELAGNVKITRDVARRLPSTTTVESCFTQACVPGQCRVGTQCLALGAQDSYGLNFTVETQWRPKSTFGVDSPVQGEIDNALLIPAKTKRYLSVIAKTPSTCFVLPAQAFGSKTAYPAPQAGSTCAAPLKLAQPGALCPFAPSPCQNLKGDLLEVIDRLHVEGSHNAGTSAAVLPARVVAAVPSSSAPTVQSTSPGIPLDWSLNVAP